jgi:PAS domain S-box-containing protein
MTHTRELSRLFLVVTLLVGFSASSITFQLFSLTPGIQPPPDRYPLAQAQEALLPLCFLGLLWVTYRRWKDSGERLEDLDDIISSIHPVALMVVSPDRTIRMCNPVLARIFGYSADEVINRKTDFLYCDRRSRPENPREVHEALESQGFHMGSAWGKRKNGERFPLEIITGNMSGKDGAVLLLRDITERKQEEEEMIRQCDQLEDLVKKRTDRLVATRDNLLREIGERKRAEETVRRFNEELEERVRERTRDLEKAYEELKQIDKLKDDFLSTVSHEFRTPLTSIMSFSEILMDFPEENLETKREFQSIIYSESQRLTRLINNLLDLSKIQAGKMEWSFQPVAPANVVERAVLSIHSLGTKKDLHLEQDVDPCLPPFLGDEDRIMQVFINLLSNAIKFTPAGGSVVFRAGLLEDREGCGSGPLIHFSVQDTGKGILPKDLDRIFDSFSQCAEDLTKKPGGTGLGLSICRKIVAAHLGDIWAESVHGQGSTFHVTLPLDLRNSVQQAPTEIERAPSPASTADA